MKAPVTGGGAGHRQGGPGPGAQGKTRSPLPPPESSLWLGQQKELLTLHSPAWALAPPDLGELGLLTCTPSRPPLQPLCGHSSWSCRRLARPSGLLGPASAARARLCTAAGLQSDVWPTCARGPAAPAHPASPSVPSLSAASIARLQAPGFVLIGILCLVVPAPTSG